MKNPRLNILKCYALSFAWGFALLQAVIMPFFNSKGLAVAQVFQLQSAFAFTLLLLDLPTGYFSDRMGRRPTLILASTFKGVGATLLVAGHGFPTMLTAWVLLGVGNSFLSGADVSMLYESHAELQNPTARAGQLRGRMYLASFLAVASGAVVGGLLASSSLQLAGIANAAMAWTTLPIALSTEEPARRGPRADSWSQLSTLRRELLDQGAPMRAFLLMAGIYGVAPIIATHVFQAKWSELELDLAWYGVVGAIQNLASGLAGFTAIAAVRRWGVRRSLLGLGLLPVAAFTLARGTVFPILVCAVVLLELVRSMVNVVLMDEINQRIASTFRGTINSLVSCCNRTALFSISPLLGGLTQSFGTAEGFGFLALLFTGAFCLVTIPALAMIHRGARAAAAAPTR